MVRVTRRVAKKARTCAACLDRIEPGEVYLEQVASPNHGDLGNHGWQRLAECAICAFRNGRYRFLLAPRKHIAGRRRSPRRRPVRIVTVHLPDHIEVPA